MTTSSSINHSLILPFMGKWVHPKDTSPHVNGPYCSECGNARESMANPAYHTARVCWRTCLADPIYHGYWGCDTYEQAGPIVLDASQNVFVCVPCRHIWWHTVPSYQKWPLFKWRLSWTYQVEGGPPCLDARTFPVYRPSVRRPYLPQRPMSVDASGLFYNQKNQEAQAGVVSYQEQLRREIRRNRLDYEADEFDSDVEWILDYIPVNHEYWVQLQIQNYSSSPPSTHRTPTPPMTLEISDTEEPDPDLASPMRSPASSSWSPASDSGDSDYTPGLYSV